MTNERNDLLRGELHVCPICYVLLGGSREKDPLKVLLSDGGSFLDRLMNGSKVVFHSKKKLVDHMETCHRVTEASSRRFIALFHRHKLRDADGLTQSFVHSDGGMNFNRYWESFDETSNFRRREIFNQLFFLSAGIRNVKECHRPDELFDANCAVINGKDIWNDLLRDNDEIIDHDAEDSFEDEAIEDSSEDGEDCSVEIGSPCGENGSPAGEGCDFGDCPSVECGECDSPCGEYGLRPCEIEDGEIDEVLKDSSVVIESDTESEEEEESLSEKFRREIRNIRRKKRFRIDD